MVARCILRCSPSHKKEVLFITKDLLASFWAISTFISIDNAGALYRNTIYYLAKKLSLLIWFPDFGAAAMGTLDAEGTKVLGPLPCGTLRMSWNVRLAGAWAFCRLC